MKKMFSLSVALLLLYNVSFAQDATVKGLQSSAAKPVKSNEKDGWTRTGSFVLNFNQGSLHNWAAGGEQNTLGINSLLNVALNYRKQKNTWDNYFDLALGFQNASSFSRFRKIDDRVDITSKYGRQVSKNWYLGFLVNFNTQSLRGFDYSVTPNNKISNFLTPGKLLFSPGADFKPNNDFSLFMSPATIRWIFKNDKDFRNKLSFGVDSGKSVSTEFGAFLTAKYTKALAKWASYTGRMDLFSNYRHNPKNVDLFFTNLLVLKYNKWLGSTISLDFIYDDDILSDIQIKEILGIGVTLKL